MASIREKSTKKDQWSFEIRVFRGRDPETGKQLYYRKQVAFPRTYTRARAQKEVEKAAAIFEADCKAGKVLTKREQKQAELEARIIKASEMTFDQYAEVFLKAVRATSTMRTYISYKSMLGRISVKLGKIHMKEINRLTIKSLIMDYQQNGVNLLTGKQGLSLNTIRRLWAVLHRFFAQAVEDEIIPFSPMESMKLPKMQRAATGSEKNKCLSPDEVHRFIKCLAEEDLMWQAYCMVMIDTGCRKGEVTALEWSDIDFLTGEVQITKNAQYAPELGDYTTTPKSGRPRKVFLSEAAQTVLYRWKVEQADHFKKFRLQPSQYCFSKCTGERIATYWPDRFFRAFGKKHGFKQLHAHMLRHTAATLAIMNGADVVNVSQMLGHSTPMTTLSVYAHANDQGQRKTRELLSQALSDAYSEITPADECSQNTSADDTADIIEP